MRQIELLNVEFGDCTALIGDRKSLLMVDCGSINNKLRSPEMDMHDVFRFIMNRYRGVIKRDFLLTHFHRDHYCGFNYIIKNDPRYFRRIYLPHIPLTETGRNPILELAVYSYIFLPPETDISQVNTACITALMNLSEKTGTENIFTLKTNDSFYLDGTEFTVLSPDADNFVCSSKIIDAADRIRNKAGSYEFGTAVDSFISCFNRCSLEFSASRPVNAILRRRALDDLRNEYEQIKELRSKYRTESLQEFVSGIFSDRSFSQKYSETVNSASVVFHNSIPHGTLDDILMTGDTTPETVERICGRFHESYYAVKLPHHGTSGGYSPIITSLNSPHLLISCGEYNKKISVYQEYTVTDSIRHCTNSSACPYLEENGSCCNRLSFCGECGDLTLRCSANRSRSIAPGCGIYVITPAGGRSCFCE